MCECNNKQLVSIATILLNIQDQNNQVQCVINQVSEQICNITSNQQQIYASLASVNPLAIAAEYPTQEGNNLVYSTIKVRFLDMLNPNIVVLFKGTVNAHLPVFFKDTINFQHTVTVGDLSTIAYADELINNYNYPALYFGNYIILNPTEQTLEDFKNGTL